MSALALGVLLAALSACQKQQGPADRAGKDVDRAAEQFGKQVEKIGQNLQNVANGG